MAGMGTRDEMLIRLAVRCREPNLMQAIKAQYQSLYGKSLAQRIEVIHN
jgi:annexin A7/11